VTGLRRSRYTMVCYMLAVERRQQDFVPAEEFSRTIAV
jgi:hypothetical protein